MVKKTEIDVSFWVYLCCWSNACHPMVSFPKTTGFLDSISSNKWCLNAVHNWSHYIPHCIRHFKKSWFAVRKYFETTGESTEVNFENLLVFRIWCETVMRLRCLNAKINPSVLKRCQLTKNGFASTAWMCLMLTNDFIMRII